MRQIVLDTETTGLRVEDGHRLIEIGCIEMINRRLTQRHFHFYVNPEREVEAGALAVHGITNHFLQDKPLFNTIARDFIDFIDGAELIIHNAPFDVSFLNHELMLTRQGYKSISDYCSVVDTLKMARQLHVGQRNSLDALCKRYAVDNSKRDLHGALMDAHLLAQVYLAMTGGQGDFFDALTDKADTVAQQAENAVATSLHQHKLHVIYADESEAADHDRYLEAMKKKGKCIWLDKETNC
jgi:DNA polymerase-3 subunit epsilon